MAPLIGVVVMVLYVLTIYPLFVWLVTASRCHGSLLPLILERQRPRSG